MRTNIDFITDSGKINFSVMSKFVCSTCKGINEGIVNRRKINYIDTDGAEYVDDLYDERTITLEGYIAAASDTELERARCDLTRICNGKNRGKFVWSGKTKRYFTDAIGELPEFGDRVGNVLPFVCTFIAYDFYWKDDKITSAAIASFEDHIKSTFTFPLVFTTKKSKADILNNGDIEADVLITISCKETSGTDGVLKIYNHTTGKQMILNHNIVAGEVIKIDTKNCDITTTGSSNLLSKMDPSSEFFKLALGLNTLEVVNTNSNCVYSCVCEHYNTYVGV